MHSSADKARALVQAAHAKIDRNIEMRVEGAKKAKSHESISDLARHTRKLASIVRSEAVAKSRKVRKAAGEISDIAKEKKAAAVAEKKAKAAEKKMATKTKAKRTISPEHLAKMKAGAAAARAAKKAME